MRSVNSRGLLWWFPFAVAAGAACSSSPGFTSVGSADDAGANDGAVGSGPDSGSKGDGGSANGETGTGTTTGCPRAAAIPSRVRKALVSHPNDASGAKANVYEVLELGLDGALTRTGPTFMMGRNVDAPIRFSPDGSIGIALQDEDGTLGIVRFDAAGGAPVVVSPSFGKEFFYANWFTWSADGSRIFVADSNRSAGGGIHEVAIACDGAPTYVRQVLAAPGAGGISLLGTAGRAVVAAASAGNAPAGNDAFLVDLANGGLVVDSVALFGDNQLAPHGVGITPDGLIGLVPDGNDAFGTSRLGVLSLDHGIKKVTVLNLPGPSGVAMSPFGNAALVTAAGGSTIDGIYPVKINAANAAAPVTVGAKVAATPKPQLPTGPVVIEVGDLKGLALVAEVEGIRRMQFDAAGTLKDLGLYVLEGGLEESPGSIGVQP